MGSPIHDPATNPLPGAKTEVKTTTCYMCACRCGIRVHLRDGKVRYIEGNPEHPLNKGILCAKGSSGIMKQYSPARLTQPLIRKRGSERGSGEFEPISWEETFKLLTERLGKLRATDPKRFALFTGRDQMQALTGLFARQYGTPNYAAHGGFCSVNMAAGMIYTIGGSFWEFGGPDLDRAQAVRDDRHRRGPPQQPDEGLAVQVQAQRRPLHRHQPGPHRLCRHRRRVDPDQAPAPTAPCCMAIIRELIALGLYDRDFVARYTNGGQLVNQNEASDDFGMMMRNDEGDVVNPLRSTTTSTGGTVTPPSRCPTMPRAATRRCSAATTCRMVR